MRPLIWLFIFAAGFRQVLGVSIIPPYSTYVLYETFVMPGLVGMILLFNAMQSSLSMVYDRETGAMRTLLVSPFPRSFLLLSKLIGGVFVALLQAYVFLAIARLWDAWTWSWQDPILTNLSQTAQQFMVVDRACRAISVLPALILSGLMLGSLALFMSSVIKQLENFAGVMNFVIFPMFFASSALYPLWRIKELQRAALRDLPPQSIHACCGADPLRALRPNRPAGRARPSPNRACGSARSTSRLCFTPAASISATFTSLSAAPFSFSGPPYMPTTRLKD